MTLSFKGCEIKIFHNSPNKRIGLLKLSISKNQIFAYANSSLTSNEILRYLESHWSDFCEKMKESHTVNMEIIVDSASIKKKQVQSKVKHIETVHSTVEGIVRANYGWFRSGTVICDCCGCSVESSYNYSTETGGYSICYNCRNAILKSNPFFRERSVNFEGSSRKH